MNSNSFLKSALLRIQSGDKSPSKIADSQLTPPAAAPEATAAAASEATTATSIAARVETRLGAKSTLVARTLRPLAPCAHVAVKIVEGGTIHSRDFRAGLTCSIAPLVVSGAGRVARLLNIVPITVFELTPIAVGIAPVRVAVATGVNVIALLADKAFAAPIDHSALFTASNASRISSAAGEALGAGPVIAAFYLGRTPASIHA